MAKHGVERLSRHHLISSKDAQKKASKAGRKLVGYPGLIVPMKPELHNVGEDSLHANVENMPIFRLSMANHLWRVVRAECDETSYMNNMDTLINTCAELAETSHDFYDTEIAEYAYDNLKRQRSYVAKSLGHIGTLFVPQDMYGL